MDAKTKDEGRKPAVAKAGTAAQGAQAAKDPAVIGAAEMVVEPGGPGVGAARVANETSVSVSRPQAGPIGDALATLPALSDDDRAELDGYRRAVAENDELRRALSDRAELDHFRRLRGGPAGVVVDAADVRGRRVARAVTAIKRDGVLYGPGARADVPVDFAAYTELVQIGAITDTPWDQLERAEA